MAGKVSLLSKAAGAAKEFVEEVVTVTLNRISNTSNPNKVIIRTDAGDFFVFTSVFSNSVVPIISKPVKVELVLREKGEFVNVISVAFNTEDLGKYNLVASYHNPVVL